MDNECSTILKTFIQDDNDMNIQFVEPQQHRVNASERAIQTFKNHFISGLCTAHPQFPLQLWCEILPQSEITLNLLRRAQCNNKLSAYAVLEGKFNFDKMPLAPPGTKALVFDNKKNVHCGHPTQRMRGTLILPCSIICVSKFLLQQQRDLPSAKLLNFSPVFLQCPLYHMKNTQF